MTSLSVLEFLASRRFYLVGTSRVWESKPSRIVWNPEARVYGSFNVPASSFLAAMILNARLKPVMAALGFWQHLRLYSNLLPQTSFREMHPTRLPASFVLMLFINYVIPQFNTQKLLSLVKIDEVTLDDVTITLSSHFIQEGNDGRKRNDGRDATYNSLLIHGFTINLSSRCIQKRNDGRDATYNSLLIHGFTINLSSRCIQKRNDGKDATYNNLLIHGFTINLSSRCIQKSNDCRV
ncbi:hypothetical protein J6590_085612 [Homalodisca vitripennis]|nr:hypothetical protein J6590_085612 [Homalodisca vitripennis]